MVVGNAALDFFNGFRAAEMVFITSGAGALEAEVILWRDDGEEFDGVSLNVLFAPVTQGFAHRNS